MLSDSSVLATRLIDTLLRMGLKVVSSTGFRHRERRASSPTCAVQRKSRERERPVEQSTR